MFNWFKRLFKKRKFKSGDKVFIKKHRNFFGANFEKSKKGIIDDYSVAQKECIWVWVQGELFLIQEDMIQHRYKKIKEKDL